MQNPSQILAIIAIALSIMASGHPLNAQDQATEDLDSFFNDRSPANESEMSDDQNIEDKALLARIAEIEAVDGRDFPRTMPVEEILTVAQLPGLRIYLRDKDKSASDRNTNCVPNQIHYDVSSRFLLANIAQALTSNNDQLAKLTVWPALSQCWGVHGSNWPDLPGRLIVLHYMGNDAGTIEFSSRMSADGYELFASVGEVNILPVEDNSEFLVEEGLLDRFWSEWLNGLPFSEQLVADIAEASLQNSDLAAAALYQKFELRVGDTLQLAFDATLDDLFDAAVLGDPQAALMAAQEIARILKPSAIVTSQTTALTDSQANLMKIMNTFYGKTWIIKYLPAIKSNHDIANLKLGLEEMTQVVMESGTLRTTTDQLSVSVAEGSEPSATSMLHGLRSYHDADCSRYRPYVDYFGVIMRTFSSGDEFDGGGGFEFSWTVKPTPVRAGSGCAIAIDFTSLPMTITSLSIQSCQEQSVGIYSCSVTIGFDCPLRGVYSNVSGLSDLVGAVCGSLEKDWTADLNVEVERQGQVWRVLNAEPM